jgi:hypothetical protein
LSFPLTGHLKREKFEKALTVNNPQLKESDREKWWEQAFYQMALGLYFFKHYH